MQNQSIQNMQKMSLINFLIKYIVNVAKHAYKAHKWLLCIQKNEWNIRPPKTRHVYM